VPFIHYDQIEKEFVTPKHSTAYGELATGEFIEVGRLRFNAGEGANEHQHPHEQIIVVLSGRLRNARTAQRAASGHGSGGLRGAQLQERDQRSGAQDLMSPHRWTCAMRCIL
jgi:hypothetical protein